MIALFLLGLLAGAVIAIVVASILNLSWFYKYSKNIIKEAPEKKVFIVNLNNVYNDLRQNVYNDNKQVNFNQMPLETDHSKENISVKSTLISDKQFVGNFSEKRHIKLKESTPLEISDSRKEMLLSELESMCNETPYVVAEYDEAKNEVENYKAIQSDSTDDDFIKYMEENDGLILVGA